MLSKRLSDLARVGLCFIVASTIAAPNYGAAPFANVALANTASGSNNLELVAYDANTPASLSLDEAQTLSDSDSVSPELAAAEANRDAAAVALSEAQAYCDEMKQNYEDANGAYQNAVTTVSATASNVQSGYSNDDPDNMGELQSAQAALDAAQAALKEATEQKETAEDDLLYWEAEVTAAQKKVDESGLSPEVSAALTALNEAKANLAAAEANNKVAGDELRAAQEAHAEAKSKLAPLEERVSDAQTKASDANTKVEAAKAAVTAAQNALDNAQSPETVAQLEQELENAKSTLTSAQAEQTSATNSLNEAKNKLAAAESECAAKQAAYEAALSGGSSDEIAAAKAAMEEAQTTYNDAVTAQGTADSNYTTAYNELQTALTKYNEMQDALTTANDNVTTAKGKVDAAQKVLDELVNPGGGDDSSENTQTASTLDSNQEKFGNSSGIATADDGDEPTEPTDPGTETEEPETPTLTKEEAEAALASAKTELEEAQSAQATAQTNFDNAEAAYNAAVTKESEAKNLKNSADALVTSTKTDLDTKTAAYNALTGSSDLSALKQAWDDAQAEVNKYNNVVIPPLKSDLADADEKVESAQAKVTAAEEAIAKNADTTLLEAELAAAKLNQTEAEAEYADAEAEYTELNSLLTNLKAQIQPLADAESAAQIKYGEEQEDGTYSGTLGAVNAANQVLSSAQSTYDQAVINNPVSDDLQTLIDDLAYKSEERDAAQSLVTTRTAEEETAQDTFTAAQSKYNKIKAIAPEDVDPNNLAHIDLFSNSFMQKVVDHQNAVNDAAMLRNERDAAEQIYRNAETAVAAAQQNYDAAKAAVDKILGITPSTPTNPGNNNGNTNNGNSNNGGTNNGNTNNGGNNNGGTNNGNTNNGGTNNGGTNNGSTNNGGTNNGGTNNGGNNNGGTNNGGNSNGDSGNNNGGDNTTNNEPEMTAATYTAPVAKTIEQGFAIDPLIVIVVGALVIAGAAAAITLGVRRSKQAK